MYSYLARSILKKNFHSKNKTRTNATEFQIQTQNRSIFKTSAVPVQWHSLSPLPTFISMKRYRAQYFYSWRGQYPVHPVLKEAPSWDWAPQWGRAPRGRPPRGDPLFSLQSVVLIRPNILSWIPQEKFWYNFRWLFSFEVQKFSKFCSLDGTLEQGEGIAKLMGRAVLLMRAGSFRFFCL